jgi:hypothetical protein
MEKKQLLENLASTSSAKIIKAASFIEKRRLPDYGEALLAAFERQILKSEAWQSQCQLIKTLAVIRYQTAAEYFQTLLRQDFAATKVVMMLSFAVTVLLYGRKLSTDFIFDNLETHNVPIIEGACAGILYLELVPSSIQIRQILRWVSPLVENEGQVISPRTYIAAVAHLWPIAETKEFLESCKSSKSQTLVEIASYALQGKRSKFVLI